MMRRMALIALVGGMAGLAGCGPVRSTMKPEGYFETRKNGDTYVFGNVPAMQKFSQTGQADTTARHFPDGSKVYFEKDGAEALVEAYMKAHK